MLLGPPRRSRRKDGHPARNVPDSEGIRIDSQSRTRNQSPHPRDPSAWFGFKHPKGRRVVCGTLEEFSMLTQKGARYRQTFPTADGAIRWMNEDPLFRPPRRQSEGERENDRPPGNQDRRATGHGIPQERGTTISPRPGRDSTRPLLVAEGARLPTWHQPGTARPSSVVRDHGRLRGASPRPGQDSTRPSLVAEGARPPTWQQPGTARPSSVVRDQAGYGMTADRNPRVTFQEPSPRYDRGRPGAQEVATPTQYLDPGYGVTRPYWEPDPSYEGATNPGDPRRQPPTRGGIWR